MNPSKINPLRKYVRHLEGQEKLPHFFCSGCGAGQVLNYYLQALDKLGLDPNSMVHIAGVGCTARIPVYISTDMLHGVHGRTLAWATGIKLTQPDLPIVVFAGDGDLASIGGNHFIHAARRNLDVTVICVNNLNFAMTGGQVAPTTPLKAHTMTTPFGNAEPRFDLVDLAIASGATHVERWTTSRHTQCVAAMQRALQHKGFSLIEIISQCPTHYGRYALRTGDPLKMIEWIDEHTLTQKKAEGMSPEELDGKLVVGEFCKKERAVFTGTTVV